MKTVPILLEEKQSKNKINNVVSNLHVIKGSSSSLTRPLPNHDWGQTLPFTGDDVTVGVENELQTAVIGSNHLVDLPISIQASSYYNNLIQQASTGETSPSVLKELDNYLKDQTHRIWENSWVRFPRWVLGRFALHIFNTDLAADKTDPQGKLRSDHDQFVYQSKGEDYIRVPVSYLLKLALADAIDEPGTPEQVKQCGRKMLNHFHNDNTSPETYSFYVSQGVDGKDAAKETTDESLLRFLVSQLLIQYANQKFRLKENGQTAKIYFSPHPPIRQKLLNELIPDSFYRDLYMSPCLSGWDKGEEKHRYMGVCHKVLSRSQLNGVGKLKEAGIITRNLVVLPNMSNISLANNGTHISIGSKHLTRLLKSDVSKFTMADEKYTGDLVIKIVEHFLPLFVGTLSAAPYRIDFSEFHPEKVLGFLPHELDSVHLRMIWRRWKKKASLRFLGHSMTPFGPPVIDKSIERLLRLKGDYVHDFRLIDYLISCLSTNTSPGLNGSMSGETKLKKDLAAMGAFDERMPLYRLYRLRQCHQMGYSGYEGRYYSVFESLKNDMPHAVNLQILITALAYKYIKDKRIKHTDIPDSPFIESERRQIFFGTAIGIPTFYVKKKSQNYFLKAIIRKARNVRSSRRYSGYLRVTNQDYRKALITLLKDDAADLIEMLGCKGSLKELEKRTDDFKHRSAGAKMTRAILQSTGAKKAINLSGMEFNRAAENYYRETLRIKHTQEAYTVFEESLKELDALGNWRKGEYNHSLMALLKGDQATYFSESQKQKMLSERLGPDNLIKMIHLITLVIDYKKQKAHQDT